MKSKVLEIDCRKCLNLIDTELGCAQYGSDADKAVENCAKDGFRNYKTMKKKILNGALKKRGGRK